MPKPALPTITIVAVVFCWLAQMLLSNQLATRGVELAELQNQATQLRADNEQLAHQLQDYRSIDKLASQSTELGFIPVYQVVSLTLPPPLAMK
jgi:hypothetical protein